MNLTKFHNSRGARSRLKKTCIAALVLIAAPLHAAPPILGVIVERQWGSGAEACGITIPEIRTRVVAQLHSHNISYPARGVGHPDLVVAGTAMLLPAQDGLCIVAFGVSVQGLSHEDLANEPMGGFRARPNTDRATVLCKSEVMFSEFRLAARKAFLKSLDEQIQQCLANLLF